MMFASDIALSALCTLEAQLVRFRDHRAQLRAAHATGDPPRALVGLEGVCRVFGDLAATYTRLRTQVITYDGAMMGDSVSSFGELALRAQALLVAAELSQIGHAPRRRGPPATALFPARSAVH